MGNQLFQYAAGRRLSHIRGTELALDLKWFEDAVARSHELQAFPIAGRPASAAMVRRLCRPSWFERSKSRLLRRRPAPPGSYIREEAVTFDGRILDLPDNVYLDGYWQSEKYFADIEPLLRRELLLPEPTDGESREFLSRIYHSESVALHVRRGDYVTSAIARSTLGPCEPGYYQRALEHLARVASPDLHVFVFSDEPAWVRANLAFDYPTIVVEHRVPLPAHSDLALMMRCRHHVIANSSFSWWGAWLCDSPGKVVVAPRRWFAREDLSSEDLVPGHWVRL